MTVQATTEGLRKAKWWEFVLRFVFGGAITAFTGWATHRWGSVVGGLFLAFPAIMPATLTLVDKHDGRACAWDECRGGVAGAAGLVAFALWGHYFAPRHGAPMVLISATVVWTGVSILFWAVGVHGRGSEGPSRIRPATKR